MPTIDHPDDNTDRERDLFLSEFVQLKAEACYVRDYRNYFGRWVAGVGILRAITSVGSIAGWLRWSHLAWLWAGLLGASQLAEALTKTFPFTKKRMALSRWCRKLDELVVIAQSTWDEIESGHLTQAQIRKALKVLRSRKQQAEARAVPNGLPRKRALFDQAQVETQRFFKQKYNATIVEW